MAVIDAITGPSPAAFPVLGLIDNFWIIILIVIGSALWEWFKKKGQTDETSGRPEEPGRLRPKDRATPPTRTASTSRQATSDWEEELRRLLGGEPPAAKPPPIAPPPIHPVIVHEPGPPPPVVIARHSPPSQRVVPPLPGQRRMPETKRSVETPSPMLKQSAAAYERASLSRHDVAERLKQIEQMTERHVVNVSLPRHQMFPSEAAHVISLIRNAHTARQAIIASVILGPSKALEIE